MTHDGCGPACALYGQPLPDPPPLTVAESLTLNVLYSESRRRHRQAYPNVTREELARNEP